MATAVTITGTGNSAYCSVTVNGTKYTAAASGITVEAGDQIIFNVYGSNGSVSIDGTTVVATGGSGSKSYTWTVPDNLSEITIALTYSSSVFNRYGKIEVVTKEKVHAHITLVDGVGWDIIGGRCFVDGVGYSIQHGRTLVNGVGYNVGREGAFDTKLYLHEYRWILDGETATMETSITDKEIKASVVGSGSNYAGVEFRVYKMGQPYLLPEGTVVTFSNTGSETTNGEYAVRFATDIEDNSVTAVKKYTNLTNSNKVYTVTTPCYMLFLCQVRGNSTCNLTVTQCEIDGERVWAK